MPNALGDLYDKIASTMNAGWGVHVRRTASGDPATSLYDLVHHIYVCDTHTGWIAAGSLSKDQLQAGIAAVKAMPAPEREALPEAVSTLVIRAADADSKAADGQDPGTSALNLAMADMTMRRTFELGMAAAGSRELHWVQVVYRLADGSNVIRPMAGAGDPNHRGLFAHEHLLHFISRAVKADLDPASNSSTSQMIRAGGGTEIHASLLPERAQAQRPRQA